MQKKVFRTLIGAIALLGLTGCLPDYFPPTHVERRLGAKDLVGVWSLTTPSRELLGEMSLVDSSSCEGSIRFDPSGMCSFQSYSQSNEMCIVARGTWNLTYGDNLAIRGRKANVLEIWLDVKRPTGKRSYERLFFTEKHRSLILWHPLGDADARIFGEYNHTRGEAKGSPDLADSEQGII